MNFWARTPLNSSSHSWPLGCTLLIFFIFLFYIGHFTPFFISPLLPHPYCIVNSSIPYLSFLYFSLHLLSFSPFHLAFPPFPIFVSLYPLLHIISLSLLSLPLPPLTFISLSPCISISLPPFSSIFLPQFSSYLFFIVLYITRVMLSSIPYHHAVAHYGQNIITHYFYKILNFVWFNHLDTFFFVKKVIVCQGKVGQIRNGRKN